MTRQRGMPRRSPRASARRSPVLTFGLIAIGVCALLGIALAQRLGMPWYAAWIAAASLTTFLLYGIDKRQAKASGVRVPEVVLHALALAGGVIGGWLGMFWWRHKTLHPSFRLVLTISTILHCAIFWWVLTNTR
jgi:uncharacterized membrane protein YsdA (DUF1294 family)